MREFDTDIAAPFEVLGQEIRLGIITALVEKRVEDPEDPVVSFSDLYERVDVTDSGQFNYHLDKLTDWFVRATDDGYELNAAGREVAGAILAGTFDPDAEWGPEPLDHPCRECAGPVAAKYANGLITVECENGHLNHRDFLPQSIVERTSLSAAMELATLTGVLDLELLVEHTCPICYGGVEMEVDPDHEMPRFEARCVRCGHFMDAPVSLAVLPHPVLQTFFLERGTEIRKAPLWTVAFLVDPDRVTVEAVDPLRIRVDASVDDEEATFVLDGDCSVVEYDVDALPSATG